MGNESCTLCCENKDAPSELNFNDDDGSFKKYQNYRKHPTNKDLIVTVKSLNSEGYKNHRISEYNKINYNFNVK